MSLLEVQVREKRYGEQTVLRQLSLAVQPGEIVGLVGASGCGKSTLLRLLAGLDAGYEGSLRFEGRALTGTDPAIGFIFQEPRLFPWLTVAQNVGFDLTGTHERDPRVAELLAEVGLQAHADALPKQLSGGQAQRVAIARGLYRRPRLLLLDEPFSAVDAFTRMKLQDLLLRVVAHHGVTVLLVTHDLDEAVFLSDRVLVLDHQPGPLRETLPLALPRPRSREAATLSAERARLLQLLHQAHAI